MRFRFFFVCLIFSANQIFSDHPSRMHKIRETRGNSDGRDKTALPEIGKYGQNGQMDGGGVYENASFPLQNQNTPSDLQGECGK